MICLPFTGQLYIIKDISQVIFAIEQDHADTFSMPDRSSKRTRGMNQLAKLIADRATGQPEPEKPAKAAPGGAGDAWTWTAIDADTKLVPCWMIGPRDGGVAYEFMTDLASRLASRVQLTTDGLKAYLEAVEGAFGADIDFAQLVKLYGDAPNAGPERKYSPNVCLGARPTTA